MCSIVCPAIVIAILLTPRDGLSSEHQDCDSSRCTTTESACVFCTANAQQITGAIGASVIQALGTAGFQVQALTRMQPDVVPRPINAIKVDYSDEKTLCNVLRGQDAVVSCLGDTPAAVEAQEALLTACIAAGVKRFIPSEFGSDTTNERVRSYPFFDAKVRLQQRLEEVVRVQDDFSYSLLITGPFLDWGLSTVPFIINIGNRTAEGTNTTHLITGLVMMSTTPTNAYSH